MLKFQGFLKLGALSPELIVLTKFVDFRLLFKFKKEPFPLQIKI